MPLESPTRKPRKPLAYNRAVEQVRAKHQALLRESQWLFNHQKLINAMLRRLDPFEEVLAYEPSVSFSEWLESECVFSISATIKGIEGFKDAKLEALLTAFIDADETKSQDYPQYMNRDYTFTFKISGSNHKIVVGISAYAKDDSPTCRKVLKEVKVVQREERVYEMLCDGEEVIDNEVLPKLAGVDAQTQGFIDGTLVIGN